MQITDWWLVILTVISAALLARVIVLEFQADKTDRELVARAEAKLARQRRLRQGYSARHATPEPRRPVRPRCLPGCDLKFAHDIPEGCQVTPPKVTILGTPTAGRITITRPQPKLTDKAAVS